MKTASFKHPENSYQLLIFFVLFMSACVPHKAALQKKAQQNLVYLESKLRNSSDSCRCCKHRLDVMMEGNKDDKFTGMNKAQIRELMGIPDVETDKVITYKMCVKDAYAGGDTVRTKFWGKLVFEFSHKMVKKSAFLPL